MSVSSPLPVMSASLASGLRPAEAAPISILMVLFYIPMSYFVDQFFFNRQLRKSQRERDKAQQGS